jgi:hypothetical protein
VKVLYSGYAPYRYLPEDFGEHCESVVNTPYFELVEPAKSTARCTPTPRSCCTLPAADLTA